MDFATNITKTATALQPLAETVRQFTVADWAVGFIGLCLLAVKITDGKLHHIPDPAFDLWFSYPQGGQVGKAATPTRTRNINTKMTESVCIRLRALIAEQRLGGVLGDTIRHSKGVRKIPRPRTFGKIQHRQHGRGPRRLRSQSPRRLSQE